MTKPIKESNVAAEVKVIKQRKPACLTAQNREVDLSLDALTDAELESGDIRRQIRTNTSLQTADFNVNKLDGKILSSKDAVLGMVQDTRYGTSLRQNQGGGDFSNKIVLAVGCLNEGKSDGDVIDLCDPNLRYGAGLTIYQRTDVGKDFVFQKDTKSDAKKIRDRERKATTPTPQRAASVFEATADVIEIKGRQSVNIVVGCDPTIPSYGDCAANGSPAESANTCLLYTSPSPRD